MPTQTKASDQPDPRDIDGQTQDDVEGHSMLLDPSTARNLAASRSREIERQVKDQQRAREARSKDTKQR